MRFANDGEGRVETPESADGQLGRTSDATMSASLDWEAIPRTVKLNIQLQKLSPFILRVLGHDLDQVLDTARVQVVAVVGLEGMLDS